MNKRKVTTHNKISSQDFKNQIEECNQSKTSNQVATTSDTGQIKEYEQDIESQCSEDQSSLSISSSDVSSFTSGEDQELSEEVSQNQGWLSNFTPQENQRHEISDVGLSNNNNPPVFGEVNVKSSENVHLGSRTSYKGPVTINQYLYNAPTSVTQSNCNENNLENEKVNRDESTRNENVEESQCLYNTIPQLWKTRRWILITCLVVVIILLTTLLSIWYAIHIDTSTKPNEEITTTIAPILVPSAPKEPLQINQTDRDAVLIRWGIPESDGGSPIEGYKIEAKDVQQHIWSIAINVNASLQYVTLTELKENHEYYFRVFAKNKIGFSKPLESDRPFLIEPLPALEIVSREKWEAQPAKTQQEKLKLPAPYAIICSTIVGGCNNFITCVDQMKFFQKNGIKAGHGDIDYNFLVGGDGLIYEGRGWDIQGNHTALYNNKSISISFIGYYMYDDPTDKQFESTKMLLEFGLREKYLTSDYKLMGQNQMTGSSESPGYSIIRVIVDWEHYSRVP